MFKTLQVGLAVFAVALAATSSFGQVITEIKTPPLKDSDTVSLSILFHNNDPAGVVLPNWAGSRIKVHIEDNQELDVDGIEPFTGMIPSGLNFGPDPFGPRSDNRQSSPLMFTVWHPEADNSGITLQPSVNQPLINMKLHVKGSSPKNNSDVDLSMMFSPIFHIPPPPESSQFIDLPQSAWLWVTSNIMDPAQLPHGANSTYYFPDNGPRAGDPDAHWLHLTEQMRFHLFADQGSNFFATFANRATLGIEHIPEPTSLVLLAGGIVCVLMGRRALKCRRAA